YHFVAADAAYLPFRPSVFDHVAVLDVFEHIAEQTRAGGEIEAVLGPQGSITFFGPAANWRFPYHRWMRSVALPEGEVLERWGHRVRGYSAEQLVELFPHCAGGEVVRYHEGALAFRVDVEFSRLPFLLKVVLWTAGEAFYRLARPFRSPGEPICFGVRLRKLLDEPSATEVKQARVS
ncbi:MAG: methyltransferase domain-containing protein, partial [Candidatus Binatia bacterium]